MKRLAIAVLCFITASIVTAQVTVPNTFTPGTSISASAMNANFTALLSAINSMQTTIATQAAQIAALQSTSNLDSSLASPNGYLNLHGGLALQWGTASASSAGHGTLTTITFPTGFANAVVYANATPNFNVTTQSIWYLISTTKTTATFQRSNNNNYDTGTTFKWLAVGY